MTEIDDPAAPRKTVDELINLLHQSARIGSSIDSSARPVLLHTICKEILDNIDFYTIAEVNHLILVVGRLLKNLSGLRFSPDLVDLFEALCIRKGYLELAEEMHGKVKTEDELGKIAANYRRLFAIAHPRLAADVSK